MAASKVLTFGLLPLASALIAARRILGSVFPKLICAWVNCKISFTVGSCSFAKARSKTGSRLSSALVCSCFAAARRTDCWGADSLSAASAAFSSRRTRLFMSMEVKFSGAGLIGLAVSASIGPSAAWITMLPSGATLSVPSISACNAGIAARSAASASLLMATILSSFSSAARPFSSSASSAKLNCGKHSNNHSHLRKFFTGFSNIIFMENWVDVTPTQSEA